MNLFRTTPQSFFCFDEPAAGTGGAAAPPAPAAVPPAAAPAPTPAPAATPATEATPLASVPAADPSDPFSGIGQDFDDDLDFVDLGATPPTDGGVAPVAAAPAVDPAKPAAPGATAPVPPVPPDPAQVVATPTPTDASPRVVLDQTVDGFKANQAELGKWAAENLFKLSKEDAEALTMNAEEALPQLAGKVYAQILVATGNLIKNLVPGLIDHTIETSGAAKAKSQEAIGEFYKTNSDLNEKDHGDLVKSWARQFRQANPKATRAEAIEFVGRVVRAQVGLPVLGAAAPAAVPRATPFAPARPGGRQAPPAAEHDPYAGLGQDFE